MILRSRLSRARTLAVAAAAAAAPFLPASALAHGFGQRFDLPLPLGFWLVAAGASIVLSFLIMAVFLKERLIGTTYPQYDLLRIPALRWLGAPLMVAGVRVVAVAIFLLTIAAGLFGEQSAYSNIIVTLVWVIFWAGFAFFASLVGNIWQLVNPIRTLYSWGERIVRRVSRNGSGSTGQPYPGRPYPHWLGVWPGVLFFAGFAWSELIWGGRTVPRDLALAVIAYSAVAWLGMALWGRETWQRHGDVFALAFGVLARFAPLAAPSSAEAPKRALYLRPYGAGLLTHEGVTSSFMVFVLLLLSTVSFDGFLETPSFQGIVNALYSSPAINGILSTIALAVGLSKQQVLMTGMLILFPLFFVAAFLITSAVMVRLTRALAPESRASGISTGLVARSFVLTLIPIAVAYHLAHYVWFLFTTGQYIVPLASDPFGYGWDLFGTAGYRVNYGVMGPYFFWYTIVTLIVIGHVIAVFLAHVEALRLFGTRRAALVSQIPMVVLMVAYTMSSLWILAQPIVG